MQFGAWLRSSFQVARQGRWLAFTLLTSVCSFVFITTLTLWIWGNAHAGIEIDYAWFLMVQSVAVVIGVLAFSGFDVAFWCEVRPHNRFAFLAFCCLASPWAALTIFDTAPLVLWMGMAIGWSGFVFFYTRFFFTYRVFCDVCD